MLWPGYGHGMWPEERRNGTAGDIRRLAFGVSVGNEKNAFKCSQAQPHGQLASRGRLHAPRSTPRRPFCVSGTMAAAIVNCHQWYCESAHPNVVGIALKMACTATKFRSLSVRVQIKQTKTAGQLVLSRTRRCAWICPTPAPSSPTGSLKFPSPSPIRRHYTPTRAHTQKTTRKANATKAQFRSVVAQLRVCTVPRDHGRCRYDSE